MKTRWRNPAQSYHWKQWDPSRSRTVDSFHEPWQDQRAITPASAHLS